MSIILSGTDGLSDVDGSASTPAIRGTDTNTGIFFPAADTIAFAEGGVESMRIDSSGNVGIGTSTLAFDTGSGLRIQRANAPATIRLVQDGSGGSGFEISAANTNAQLDYRTNSLLFLSAGTERMRITSDGRLLIGTTASNVNNSSTIEGVVFEPNAIQVSRSAEVPLQVNRITNDGTLVGLRQAGTEEGSISVSGTTVSYNGGHLSRWAQTIGAKDESLLKGTVLSNLDEMNEYVDAEGNPVDNEQLNKVKVSDVEGDVNVAGVFVNWSHDEAHNVDEINMAMTGDMIIRIAEGVVVQKGDLLMSAGDGTAKPQGDDIVRSKTIAKVTSTHVTCTYADGSYCVPCVLMAC